MKHTLATGAMLAAWLLAAPAWAEETGPDTLVKNTTQEVLAIIKQDKDIQTGKPSKLHDLVEAKVLPHFNFTRMTRLAVGKNWSKASPEQQQELVKEFRTLLVRTYSNALSGTQDRVVEVKPLRLQPGDTETNVRTQVVQSGGRQPISIDYSMEKTADGWKVYDVTVGGVSLVTNYRGSFDTQVRQGGIEGLIKTLTEKNRSLQADKSAVADQ